MVEFVDFSRPRHEIDDKAPLLVGASRRIWTFFSALVFFLLSAFPCPISLVLSRIYLFGVRAEQATGLSPWRVSYLMTGGLASQRERGREGGRSEYCSWELGGLGRSAKKGS